ncbi:Nucleoporin Nup120/160 [Artemisia annua]|uniref:Nucleoporin Nup120/160 n=1 Tax=Artemisia annua TaxID=35608 RepID=A0A2U1LKR7_ARTAN|nr:Nucleoporin Nup120/160 [Artemisia annua]
MLYTMSVDGVVCLIHLNNVTNYGSGSVFETTDVEELNTHNFAIHGTITSIAATAGFVVIGKHNGWVGCFRLGSLESGSQGFQYELQEDACNIIDHFVTKMRRRTVAPVRDLLCLEIRGRKLTFVLYENGLLQLWDLFRCTRFFDNMLEGKFSGARFKRLWAGETSDSHVLPLAIKHQPNPEDTNHTITISLYRCHDSIIDVKLSSNKIWILERDGVVLHNLSDPTESGECNFFGSLEPVVAERLFQNSEHAGSDIFRLINSVFPFAKDHNHNRANSIFMRLLSRPGIFHKSVLGATFNDFNKHITLSELHSLDPSGVKEEIISIIEHEEASRGPHSFIYCWKNFCSRYFHNWCHENAPCGLLLDSSTGAIGLIRKSSVSLFRRLSDTEILSYGSLDEIGEITRQRINLSSDLEQEVLLEVLRCTSHLSQLLGNAASAIFYECFFHKPLICPEQIMTSILKVLEVGYISCVALLVLEKRIADHNTSTKCSTDMLLSLRELYRKAGTWDTFIDVVLKHLKFLESQKNENGSDRESVFESIFNILLLLKYMLKLSVQVSMLEK